MNTVCYRLGKHCKGPNHNPRECHVTGEAACAGETNAVGLFIPSITYVCIINSKIKDNLKLCFHFYSLKIPIFSVPNQFPAKENESGKGHLLTFRKFRTLSAGQEEAGVCFLLWGHRSHLPLFLLVLSSPSVSSLPT